MSGNKRKQRTKETGRTEKRNRERETRKTKDNTGNTEGIMQSAKGRGVRKHVGRGDIASSSVARAE